MPKISIITGVFNEEKVISRAIDSVLSQSIKDFELIIVNDGSTDNTVEIVNKYMDSDSRIKLVDKRYNSGLADSLNIGISHSSGELIARMDADDTSDENRLKNQVEYLDKNKDIALVGSWSYLICLSSKKKMECKPPLLDKDIRKYMQRDNPFTHSSIMFRKSIIEKVGGYNIIQAMEDYDLWIRIAKYYKVANISSFLVTRYEDRNLYTRSCYKGLKRYDIYSRRLKYQIEAVKNFGIYPETFWYLSRTAICMALCKVGLKK